MKNNRRILIISGIVLILIILIALLWQYSPRRYNWLESYEEKSKNPYGTFVIYNLLAAYFPSDSIFTINKKLSKELPLERRDNRPMNYVFIGEGLYLDSLDVERLLSFVENGNSAFLSSKSIPQDLMFYLYYDECNGYPWNDYSFYIDSTTASNFYHLNLNRQEPFDFSYEYRGRTDVYRWHYIDEFYFCEQSFGLTKLGYTGSDSTLIYTNFARIPFGEGFFYLHTVPLAFSNIALLEEDALEYADRVFSHLQEGPIYWGAYSKISEATSRRRNNSNNPYRDSRRLSNETPLRYILSQPPLAWAWYLLLFSSLLYLLFKAKRRQRVIPVLQKNENTSLEFLKNIGKLYILQNDHRQLCLQKIKLFRNFVRNKYQIALKEVIDTAQSERIAKVSELPVEKIEALLKMAKNIQTSSIVTENTLIAFHKKVDEFYKNCK